MKCLLILDSNYLFYKNWFKLKVDLGGAYGYLKHLLSSEVPEFSSVIAAWDGGRSARRLALHPEYKAGRPKRTEEEKEDIAYQQDIVRDILSTLSIPSILLPKVEADDIIAVLARFYSRKGWKVCIDSSDQDFHQLLSYEGINIFDSHGFVKVEELPVDIELFPIYRAIVGDTSDRIKGVNGFGPKKTQKLLQGMTMGDFIRTDFYIEYKDIIERNLDLMDFKRIPVDLRKNIKIELKEQYSLLGTKTVWQKRKDFLDKCDMYGFYSLKGSVQHHSIFRKRNNNEAKGN